MTNRPTAEPAVSPRDPRLPLTTSEIAQAEEREAA